MREYKESSLAIELVCDFYKTRNVGFIKKRIEADLNIKVDFNTIIDYLNLTYDYEKDHIIIEQEYKLNEEEYEWNERSMS